MDNDADGRASAAHRTRSGAHEALAFRAAEGFEPVALSPVSPLGLNAILGRIDQNNVLSTIRNTEVLADPTAALALEAAVRRRRGEDTVRLCAACRVLRLQPVPDVPGFTQHFELFALVTAGRSQASYGFEIDALREHIAVYRRLLAAAGVDDYVVRLTDAPPQVLEALPGVVEDAGRTQGRGYYDGMLLNITATDREGNAVGLADGGRTDWTQRLLSNRKERLLTSGIGLGLMAERFPTAA
ncbi:hypothetical protein OM076_43380 [Solirubrobacter ginsenosidimutans]|uniref:Uncharacterized protein n=1 Tax=Solirubrobacter ginsenosidimutans TaxID=490573 RepID=A0A9X3N612_9ACTN|nr:hypothetical protein [Solirubrobacter ginsenosidimutans]MDA0167182.1 hypothetical protein [Solirubrobacter ginsenosidimutans]